jgi:hypothetical protein
VHSRPLNKFIVLANCSIALFLLSRRFDLFDSFISTKQIRFSSNKAQSHLEGSSALSKNRHLSIAKKKTSF